MALGALSAFWTIPRKVDRLFENVEKAQKGIDLLGDRIRALEDRMTAMEANEAMLIVEAKTALRVAASEAINQHVVQLAGRLGRLEEWHRASTQAMAPSSGQEVQPRLSAPSRGARKGKAVAPLKPD